LLRAGSIEIMAETQNDPLLPATHLTRIWWPG
jgi:uncharacterized protein (UPF0147 family)